MPKIPTFTTQARPTAESSIYSITTKYKFLTQTIGTALAPVTKAVEQHAISMKKI